MKQASRTALFALVAIAACSDSSVVAPRSPVINAPSETRGSKAPLTRVDTVHFSMVIEPGSASTFNLGAGNAVIFPANSVCDPNKTSYGPGEWNMPCTPATAPITVTVTAWLDPNGHPEVDFSPDLRFVPTADPARYVNIEFSDFLAALDPSFNILYCHAKQPKAKPTCINEALTDPTLVTVRDPVTGHLMRRIKHFSGYNVAAGYAMDGPDAGSMSMNAAPGGTAEMRRVASNAHGTRSGFMLASGDQAR